MVLKKSIICFIVLAIFSVSYSKKIEVKEPDTSDVSHPCETDDLKCIGKEFQKRGWCSRRKSHQYKDGKFTVPEIVIEMAYFNVTDGTEDVVFSGLQKGKVLEFYINKKTGKTVLTVDFTDFDVVGDAQMCYHRAQKEDLIITTVTTEHYSSVITNTIIEKGRNGLSQSETHSRIPGMPKYDLGEGLEDIHNEEVQELFAAFNSHSEFAVRDLWLRRGPVAARFYIDYVICDDYHDHSRC